MTPARLVGALALLVAACVPPAPVEERLVLEPATYQDLDGWDADDHAAALPLFLASCERWAKRDSADAVGREAMFGNAGDWAGACAAAGDVAPSDRPAARAFFEAWLAPWRVSDGTDDEGLFTGYFEPTLEGSLTPSERYTVPLYGRPDDLVTVDLGQFAEDLAGRSIAGEVSDGALVPYDDRATIVAGALAGRGLELAWVDDPVDAFFLEIQGSGQVRLADGGLLRVGYAAQNGRAYFAIGKALVERGALAKDDVSLQTIRAWLEAHPDQAAELMNLNRSYVFFRVNDGPGPVGAIGVALTPGRSLAVDRRFIAYGVPLWLETMMPGAASGSPDEPLRRLVVAQDTGGAIKGAVRGDLFFGAGAEAEWRAGHMKHPGRYFALLPKALLVAKMP